MNELKNVYDKLYINDDDEEKIVRKTTIWTFTTIRFLCYTSFMRRLFNKNTKRKKTVIWMLKNRVLRNENKQADESFSHISKRISKNRKWEYDNLYDNSQSISKSRKNIRFIIIFMIIRIDFQIA
jgi:uncharacterized protein YlbG (UPF0298 family)